MRRLTGTAVSVGVAAVVAAALSGASLPQSATIASAHEPATAIAAHRSAAPALTADRPAKAVAVSAVVHHDLAKQAAARVAAAATAKRARALAVAASHAHTVNVWTTGFQAQVNECRGGVDMSVRYGMRIVGEHWSCGGSSFPTAHGAIVRFTGLDAGTYRVLGLVATLNAYTAHTYQVPHNYQLLYQTCRGGDSHYTEFIALAKVG